MGSALSSGVTGLQAHQQMLEVAGNNLANVNTTGFKGSSIGFSELLSENISKGASPTATLGGTNPQQLGSGVGISSITRNMAQGGFENTGAALDMAISGEGYFVLNTGSENQFTRVGSFAVDANSMLVDPATGYRVQRIGSEGEADGFQVLGDPNINIPFDAAMQARATTTFNLSGNLRADGGSPTTATLTSGTVYVLASDGLTNALSTTRLDALDQYSGAFNAADVIAITGTEHDGTAVSYNWTVPAATSTLGDLVTAINSAAGFDSASATGATASLVNGQIRLIDKTTGYSLLDMNLSFTGGGSAALETPGYFQMLEAGGEDTQLTSIDVFDAMGGKHTLSGAFVKDDSPSNTWDFVLTKLTGGISQLVDRRVTGITFRASDGAFQSLTDTAAAFDIRFSNDPSTTQNISMTTGTVGMFDGLTQFKTGEGISSTAASTGQDGFTAGQLASISATDGKIMGTFSNGAKKIIATIQLSVFQNAAGLESVGKGYFVASANSGDPVALTSGSGSAGRIEGQRLEKSNVQVAEEFVTMIQAQNGFQANARTIRVANEVLRELTNLIR
ncbi:MAG: flagellar hook-basal body complex protein [Planctomycetes bacterium]|nr:flagellar hook-basal body complex protein [Planctomycetota bacterium]